MVLLFAFLSKKFGVGAAIRTRANPYQRKCAWNIFLALRRYRGISIEKSCLLSTCSEFGKCNGKHTIRPVPRKGFWIPPRQHSSHYPQNGWAWKKPRPTLREPERGIVMLCWPRTQRQFWGHYQWHVTPHPDVLTIPLKILGFRFTTLLWQLLCGIMSIWFHRNILARFLCEMSFALVINSLVIQWWPVVEWRLHTKIHRNAGNIFTHNISQFLLVFIGKLSGDFLSEKCCVDCTSHFTETCSEN